MSEYVFRDAPGFGFDMDNLMETLPMTAREYYASNCADHYGTLHEKIVRCRDCKYCMAYWRSDYCDYFKHVTNDPDGYCAWGERREQ